LTDGSEAFEHTPFKRNGRATSFYPRQRFANSPLALQIPTGAISITSMKTAEW
jgi:hypothetical protein